MSDDCSTFKTCEEWVSEHLQNAEGDDCYYNVGVMRPYLHSLCHKVAAQARAEGLAETRAHFWFNQGKAWAFLEAAEDLIKMMTACNDTPSWGRELIEEWEAKAAQARAESWKPLTGAKKARGDE